MNFFEFLTIALGLALSAFSGMFAARFLGVLGGGALGIALAISWAWVLRSGVVFGVLDRLLPVRPVCKQRRCTSEGYTYLRREGNRVFFRCQCGTVYVKEGASFQVMQESGRLEPYMRKRWNLVWKPEVERDVWRSR